MFQSSHHVCVSENALTRQATTHRTQDFTLSSPLHKKMLIHFLQKNPHVQNLITSSRRARHLQETYRDDHGASEDFHAQSDAEQAKQMGLVIVRSHLEEFLQQYPQASFYEWIASLHPENVKQNHPLDDRFLIDDNPWLLVWLDTATGEQQR